MDWFCNNLIILTENPLKSWDKTLLFEKLKTLTSCNYHRVQYFFLKLRTRFLHADIYRRVFRILFCLDLQLIAKKTLAFYIFVNNSISNQNKKKSQTRFWWHRELGNVCEISGKNIKFCRNWSLSKFSIFQTQITWFLRNNRALSKFRYRVLNNLISLIKLLKNQSVKANFKITKRDTLIKTHQANVQMGVILKTRCFYSFSIISEIITKKNEAYYSWVIYHKKFAAKFSEVSWWDLWVGDPRNFHNSTLLKNDTKVFSKNMQAA